MKKTITKLMAALALLLFVAPPLVGWGQTTETLNIGTYASAHNWNNSTAYYNACTDNVTFTGSGTGNNCKYYTSDNSWRYYSSGNGQITIACPNNNYITNITLSGTSFFTTAPDGWNYANNVFTPQEETQVNSVTIANGVGTSKITSIAVTYISSTPATVAVPTFNPVAGTYTEAQSVIISCETDGAAIYYTLDGTTPDNNSANYTDAININETTTIKAIAYIGEDASSVATAIYTIVSFEHQGTEADPYSVADAHTAIDANIGTTGVYATGIVSEIVTEYSTQYSNVTFDIVDEEGDEVFLRAYRCGGEEAPNVAVGDIAVVYGNLTKYGSTYEFAQGCEVVSLEHPTVIVAAPTFSPVGGTYIEAQTVEISTATEGADIYYTLDGSDPDMDSEMYDTPIVVSTTTTIKAVAVDGDDNFSSVSSATYTIVPESNVSNITEVGTAYNVRGTVVATNSRGFIMGDGTGYVYYYKNGAPTQSVGDMVRVYGTTGTYGQIIQFTNTATVTEATASNYNGTPEAMVITEVPDYTEGYHLSDYLEFEGALAKDGNNYLITLGEAQIQVSYPTTDQSTALTALNGRNVHVKGYFSGINSSSRFTVMLESVEEVLIPAISVSPTSIEVPVVGANGSFTLAVTAVEFSTVEIFWCDADSTAAEYGLDWISTTLTESSIDYEITANQEPYERVAYFMVKGYDADNNEILSEFVTITQAYVEAPQPGITVTPDTVNLDAGQQLVNLLDLAYENIEVEGPSSFNVHYYNADGEEIELVQGEAWLVAGVVIQDNVYQVHFTVVANFGEARTIYLRVSCGETYSNLVTINQAAPVLDYAVLPFVWEGGSSTDFLALNGVTANGLGNDYASGNAPYLIKFDGTGDYIQVKTDGQPGVVTIGVKMIGGGNTSTITIQGSADGVTFTDIEALAISGSQNEELTLETTNAFDANDRYVRMLFTKGSNVGVGPITIERGTVPSINVAPAAFDLEAVGDINGMHVTSSSVTYHNIDITQASDFHFQFYNAEGEEQEKPEWILGSSVSQIANGYQAACMISANNGPARSAYFKLYALDADSIPVYSNLVTINQGAYVAPALYTYSINGNEGETIEVEAGATIILQEGTDLNDDFTFAGWTTDPNDVSQLLTGEYTFTEEVTVFYAVYAHTTTIGSTVTRDGASYVKVTSTDDLEDGNYLIVYEEGGVAFNGSLEILDGTGNTIEVSIDNGVIAANENVDASVFTIAAMDEGYSILSASGLYIGQNSNANGVATSEVAITNTITITEGEDADIVSSSAYLRYNSASNQARFRYYKSSSYSNQKAIQLYKYTGTPTPQPVTETNYYTRVFFNESAQANINIIGPSIVPSGYLLDMVGSTINNVNPANLLIEGEVVCYYNFNGTMQRNIAACDYNENDNAGYNLIASPIDNFVPSNDNGFITDQYDLYAYNAAQELEWINYKDASNNFTSFQNNKGYLYANGANTTLKFAGLLNGFYTDTVGLAYAEGDNDMKRLTLIGNPLTRTVYYYVSKGNNSYIMSYFLTLNTEGNGFITDGPSNRIEVKPMEAFFVQASEDGQSIVIEDNSTTTGGGISGGPDDGFITPNSHLNITVSGTVSGQRGIALLDNAIVSFGEGTTMKKLYLSENSTRVYIPQSNKDYAVVRSAAQGEMPVNFKAQSNGTYTISIDAENVEMNYLHLIDNMTGADVDLLATPSYTFDAKTTDYASRFKLVFSANANENDDENETFAFFNGSVWCISNTGEATLQVVDMLGRIVSSESVNGNATLSTDNLMSGVYMFRLVNGENVKVQKVVVK